MNGPRASSPGMVPVWGQKSPLYRGFAMLSRYDNRRTRGYQDYHDYHLTGTT